VSTEEKEQQVIEILDRVNEFAADAGDVFYDIAGNWVRNVSLNTERDIPQKVRPLPCSMERELVFRRIRTA
jgi:hypothetical protein